MEFQVHSHSFFHPLSQGNGAQFPLNPRLPEASIRRRFSPQTGEPARSTSPVERNSSHDDQAQDLGRIESGLEAAGSESEVELYAFDESHELMPLTSPTSEN